MNYIEKLQAIQKRLQQPQWTDQTKVPLNFKTDLEVYGEVQLDDLKSKIFAKDSEIKSFRSSQWPQKLEKLQEDLDTALNDLKRYEETHPDTPVSPQTPPKTEPVPVVEYPPIFANLIQWFKNNWH